MNRYIASFKVLKTGHWHSEYFYMYTEDNLYSILYKKYGDVRILGVESSL